MNPYGGRIGTAKAYRGQQIVSLRLPTELIARIDQASAANYRSRTQEARARLESTFPDMHAAIVGHPTPVSK